MNSADHTYLDRYLQAMGAALPLQGNALCGITSPSAGNRALTLASYHLQRRSLPLSFPLVFVTDPNVFRQEDILACLARGVAGSTPTGRSMYIFIPTEEGSAGR